MATSYTDNGLDVDVFDFKVDKITNEDTTKRALNAYMLIDSIKGPNVTEGFQDTTTLLAWTHAFSQPAQLGRTTADGAAVTDTRHGDLTVVKQIDTMTGDLLKKCWSGDTIETITITLSRNDGHGYLEIVMNKVIITEQVILDIPGSIDTMEKLKFNYSNVKYNYTHYDEDGGALGNDVVSYDRATELVS